MNKEVYFQGIEKIGNLYLDYVFNEFEGEPILFTCVDETGKIYLCLCSEMRSIQRWIIAPSTIEILRDMLAEKHDIAMAFYKSVNIVIVEYSINGDEKNFWMRRENIDRLDLPEEGTYIRCNKQKAEKYLQSPVC